MTKSDHQTTDRLRNRRFVAHQLNVPDRRVVTAICEPLESRKLLTSVVVNTVLDSLFPANTGIVSLRNAIATANTSATPTTITFDPKVFNVPKTITQNGSILELSNSAQSITIAGPAAGVILNGNNQTGGFSIDGHVTASFSEFTITKSASGGISNGSGSKLTLSNVSINGNSSGPGAGIYNLGTMMLSNVTVSKNTADNGGGGIYNGGIMTLSNVAISGNSARLDGGGIADDGGSATLSNVTISDNTAGFDGGGIFHGHSGSAVLQNVTVSRNTASNGPGGGNGGGGIYNGGTMKLTDATVSSNTVAGKFQYGAGIFNSNNVTLINVTIAGNSAPGGGGGGGLYNFSAAATLTNVTIYLWKHVRWG